MRVSGGRGTMWGRGVVVPCMLGAMAMTRRSWMVVAAVAVTVVACGPDTTGEARDSQSWSSPAAQEQSSEIGHAPPCSHHSGRPAGVASQRNLNRDVDGSPRSYHPPTGGPPAIDAQTALAHADAAAPSSLGDPVEAVLSTMTTDGANPTLVWVLTVTDVEGAPSIGPPICTDVAVVVDGTTGQVLFGLTGTSFK
jgi:hypothetical protein